MQWELLLNPNRLGCPDMHSNKEVTARTEFQRDFDRVLFSSAFRRLQNKTQVFPFPETAMIHTRLTHSLEASSVGRSLGTAVGKQLGSSEIDPIDLGAIVSAACLAHDIGNPPFGHSGEKAITEFFKSGKGQSFLADLYHEQKLDFTQFDGNAMGFRMLTYSNPRLTDSKGGVSLTYATLAAFTKYPCSAAGTLCVSHKKAGLFSTSLSTYSDIAKELEIPTRGSKAWARHPLAFLTEAADDICYTIVDLEDGYRHHLVNYDEVSELLYEIASVHMSEVDRDNLNKLKRPQYRIGFLRAKAINSLICQVVKEFSSNLEQLLEGTYDSSLTDEIESTQALTEVREVSKKFIYSHRTILQIEAAGFQVIPGLLDMFLSALKSPGRSSSKKILELLPDEYVWDFNASPYDAIMGITTYVAGMTDTFAVDLYRNLRGVQLPSY